MNAGRTDGRNELRSHGREEWAQVTRTYLIFCAAPASSASDPSGLISTSPIRIFFAASEVFKCTKVITPGNSIIVSTLSSKSKSAPVNHPCLSGPGSGTTPVLLTLSGPGPLYLWGEGPFTVALEQLLYYSPSVALALCISGVRGHLLWLWNSSCTTHPQWPWPSVSLGWGAIYSGSGTAPVLLTLSGPGPQYLRGEGPFTLALEQLLYYSPSVALALCISGVRGRLLWLWNSDCVGVRKSSFSWGPLSFGETSCVLSADNESVLQRKTRRYYKKKLSHTLTWDENLGTSVLLALLAFC